MDTFPSWLHTHVGPISATLVTPTHSVFSWAWSVGFEPATIAPFDMALVSPKALMIDLHAAHPSAHDKLRIATMLQSVQPGIQQGLMGLRRRIKCTWTLHYVLRFAPYDRSQPVSIKTTNTEQFYGTPMMPFWADHHTTPFIRAARDAHNGSFLDVRHWD